jgi:hypothetical protein
MKGANTTTLTDVASRQMGLRTRVPDNKALTSDTGSRVMYQLQPLEIGGFGCLYEILAVIYSFHWARSSPKFGNTPNCNLYEKGIGQRQQVLGFGKLLKKIWKIIPLGQFRCRKSNHIHY